MGIEKSALTDEAEISAGKDSGGSPVDSDAISLDRFLDFNIQTSERPILGEMLDHYQRGYPDSVLSLNLLFSGLLVYLLWAFVDHQLALGWIACITIIIFWNGSVIHRVRNSVESRDYQHWALLIFIGNILLGSAWGIGGAILYNPDALAESMFVLLTIAGLASGVSSIQISLPRAFFAFVLPALLIPSAFILWRYGTSQVMPASLLVIYFGFVTHIGITNRKTLLASVSLRFEKDALLEEVKQSEVYFRALIENAADLIGVMSFDGTIQFISPSVRRVLGYEPEELEGTNFIDILHPDDCQSAIESLAEVARMGKGESVEEHRFKSKNGKWIILESRGRRLGVDQGKILIFARNTTDRAHMEQQLVVAKEVADQANKSKSKFLAQMSHEIRTPMHAILAMAEMLKNSPLENGQLQRVETLNETGQHLLDIINDILDFSSLESGDIQLFKSPFDLHHLVENVCGLLEPVAANRGIELSWDIEEGADGWRYGDEHRIRQMLINLVGNAVKFTDRGHVKIFVNEPGEDLISLMVEDTGRGVAEDQRQRIFDSFVQVNADNEYRGTGLGLAITKGLVDAMGGQIELSSELGQGSCFSVRLKLPKSTEPRPVRTPVDRSGVLPSFLKNIRVLVADDEPINRAIMQDFLSEVVGHVDLVTNGQEAVARASASNYDIILMDMRMPVMDGLTATRVIREQEALTGAAQVPIIALSAAVMAEERESFASVGCTSFLSKPVSRDVLLNELKNYAG